MQYSERERIAHVTRRLGMGASPVIATDASSVDAAIARALDLSEPAHQLVDFEVPQSVEDARNPGGMLQGIISWVESATVPTRLIEERMTWFWQDHFSTSLRKVPFPYALWQQHKTIRSHATGNFADLLKAVSTDPAMLAYLDGMRNSQDAINENFGREVMELHTIGTGNYTEEDVYEAARCFTGWVVNVPNDRSDRVPDSVALWSAFFVDRRHDGGTKTLLGITGQHDLVDALDILLDHPATRPRIASKLYTSLTGLEPDTDTTARLATAFEDYEIMPLVETIADSPGFISDEAIRTHVRTPFERLITLIQGIGQYQPRWQTRLTRNAERIVSAGFIPFAPPNPAGYPKGSDLLGPHALVHNLDLLQVIDEDGAQPDPTGFSNLNQLGIFDIAPETANTISQAPSPQHQLALAIGSPEMLLT